MLETIETISWILLAVIAAGGVLYLGYSVILYAVTGVPIVHTGNKRFPIVFDYITSQVNITEETIFMDLGCADGRVLREAQKHGFANCIGYELSPAHVWKGRLINVFLRSHVEIRRKDFLEVDISQADVIYLFLNNAIIAEISEKIAKEAKVGSLVITLGMPLPNSNPTHTDELDGVEGNAIYYYRAER